MLVGWFKLFLLILLADRQNRAGGNRYGTRMAEILTPLKTTRIVKKRQVVFKMGNYAMS